MNESGGAITWRLTATDADFDRAMANARVTSARTARSVDRDWKDAVDRTNKHFARFRQQVAVTAQNVRNFAVAARGFNLTSLIFAVTAGVTALVELASAVAAAGGAALALPSIFAAIAGAVGVVKIGVMGMSDAFKAFADGDAEKIAEALEKLSPAARSFVRTVQDMKDEFKTMQQAVQEELFVGLDASFRSLAEASLPALTSGFSAIARELNGVGKEAARVMAEPFFQKALSDSLKTTADGVHILQGAVRPLIDAMAGLLNVANPYVARLAEWVVRQAQVFSAFVNSEEGARKLTAAIDTGIDALHLLGDLISSVFSLLATLFKTTQEEGASLVRTLIGIIDKFNAWLQTAEGQREFQSLMRLTADILIEVFEIIGKVAGTVLKLITALEEAPAPVRDIIVGFLGWVTIMTPIITYLAALMGSLRLVGAAVGTFFKIIGAPGAFAAFMTGFKSMGGALSKSSGIFGTAGGFVRAFLSDIGSLITNGLGRLLPFFTRILPGAIQVFSKALFAIPGIGWIIGIVTTIIGLVAWMITDFEGFKNFWIGVWDAIKGAAEAVANWFTGNVVPVFNSVWEGIKTGLGAVGQFFTDIWNGIVNAVKAAIDFLMPVIQPFIDIFNGIIYIVTALGTIIFTIFSGIVQVITIVVTTIVQIIGVVLAGVFMWLWNNILVPTGQFFVTVFTNIWNFLVGVFNNIVAFFVTTWNGIVAFLTPVLQGIADFFTATFTNISNFFMGIWNGLVAFFTPIIKFMADFAIAQLNFLKDSINNIFNFIKNSIINPISEAVNFVAGKIREVVSAVGNALNDAFNKAKEFVGKFLQAGKDIIDGLVRGITGAKDAVVNKVKEIAAGALDAVKEFFGIHSPSRVMAKMGDYIMQGLENGIGSRSDSVISAATGVAEGVAGAFGALDGNSYDINANGAIESSLAPITAADYNAADNMTKKYEYNINSISIASEVDGEAWLRKLTQDQEIVSQGLTPQTRYN